MEKNLEQALSAYRKFKDRRYLLEHASRFILPLLGVPAVVCGLDNLLGFPVATRWVLLFLWGGSCLFFLITAFIRFCKKRPTDRCCALELEQVSGIRDNALVNGVCFRDDPVLPEELKSVFLKQSDEACARIKYPVLESGTKKMLCSALAVITVVVLYIVIFPDYAKNGIIRFLNPISPVTALNFVRFEIKPVDGAEIPLGQDLTIYVKAWKDGHPVSDLKLLVRGSGAPVLYPMHDGVFTLRAVKETLICHITAENENSRDFRIRVIQPPQLTQFTITAEPPDYTGLKPITANPVKTPETSFPVHSKITIFLQTEKGVSAALERNGKNRALPDLFELNGEQRLKLSLFRETPEQKFPGVWQGGIKAKPDSPPVTQFKNMKSNMELLYGEPVVIEMVSADDYGIASMTLTATVEKKNTILRKYTWPMPGKKNIREILLLKPTPSLLPQGASLELTLTATDFAGNQTQSPGKITIHPADPVKVLRNVTDNPSAAKCYEKLFAAIRLQESARERLAQRTKYVNRGDGWNALHAQQQIRQYLAESLNEAAKAKLQKGLLSAIRTLSTKEAPALIRLAQDLHRRPNPKDANEVLLKQTDLLVKMQKLIGALALRERYEQVKKEQKATSDAEKELFDQMKDLKDKLDKFKTSQRKIKTDTEAFDPGKADDYSEAEEKLLGDLAAKELDWAQFFKAAFNDLSKKQNQDFSNSAMADEFVELYEELQKAGEALKAKKIEIATLAEDTAMNNAESVAANIERWLADKKDYIKWNSEEDGLDKDVQLTDLPAELTDIIGDLIEQEGEEGEDEVQDSTNSFSYDSDDGLGWGVSDGSIDSMQAKGITGNVLPNQNEVGGRSGEGRSGKSSGQFVEKEATGKGGRKTPTRLVQSPFEKGTVTDKSKDGQGGATGGGKQSGTGDEGLAGQTPDQDARTGERLPGNQGELRQRTKAMLKVLSDRNLPTGDIREALAKLETLDKLGDGTGVDARRVRSEALSSLRKARAVLETTIHADAERLRSKHNETWSVRHTGSEKIPEAYSECVGEYFKALATEGEK